MIRIANHAAAKESFGNYLISLSRGCLIRGIPSFMEASMIIIPKGQKPLRSDQKLKHITKPVLYFFWSPAEFGRGNSRPARCSNSTTTELKRVSTASVSAFWAEPLPVAHALALWQHYFLVDQGYFSPSGRRG